MNSWTSFKNGCIILHADQKSLWLLISSHSCQHIFFITIATLVGVKLYLTVVLICIFLMDKVINPLFMGLLDTCMSYLEKQRLKHFLVFLLFRNILDVFQIQFLYQICDLQIFFSILWIVFLLFVLFESQSFLNFVRFNLHFIFLCLCFRCHIQEVFA